ncbi:MAG: DUF805 family protein YhaH [Roseibaca calidilacus]|uniref:DUF805 family protein YhaH n=1 Tax=Roseibaca calidilacus TaxID=1666912 RepID=A0A0P7YMN1_9RHOB|nr:DUF805 domain-containing protein [Roseibaca calidilacus]KPP89823.1 MAG: DUF805 family protein YhaH [Roseibaca calidilacus]CUX80822.1 Uncharacterized membrane protein YhaH, DUF805 family [Roseibaca calidilacus]
MTFADAVTRGFRNAFTFKGRARRPEYWWFFLFVFAGAFVIGLLEMLLLGRGSGTLVALFQLVIFLPFLAVGWRRLQDTGRPGWWLLVPSGIVVVSTLVSGSLTRAMMAGGMGNMMNGEPMGPGAMMGVGASATTVVALGVAQLLAGLVIIWWMSRPSQRGANTYGPEPRVR